jgi:hypothetical protein
MISRIHAIGIHSHCLFQPTFYEANGSEEKENNGDMD